MVHQILLTEGDQFDKGFALLAIDFKHPVVLLSVILPRHLPISVGVKETCWKGQDICAVALRLFCPNMIFLLLYNGRGSLNPPVSFGRVAGGRTTEGSEQRSCVKSRACFAIG